MAKNFYLLPILGGEEVMTEQNMRVRVLNVASVSAADAVDSAKAGQDQSTAHERTKQIKEFSSAVVFVIDSTISMDPYIERTREAVRKIYAKVEAEKLGDKVKFGLVAFRSSTKAVPALEYVSKIYADPNKVKDGADFMAKVAELKQAKVSSSAFDEDAYAGVMDAVNSIDWRPYGARYVVLITDAGAIEGGDKLSSTGMSASQVRRAAAGRGHLHAASENAGRGKESCERGSPVSQFVLVWRYQPVALLPGQRRRRERVRQEGGRFVRSHHSTGEGGLPGRGCHRQCGQRGGPWQEARHR